MLYGNYCYIIIENFPQKFSLCNFQGILNTTADDCYNSRASFRKLGYKPAFRLSSWLDPAIRLKFMTEMKIRLSAGVRPNS